MIAVPQKLILWWVAAIGTIGVFGGCAAHTDDAVSAHNSTRPRTAGHTGTVVEPVSLPAITGRASRPAVCLDVRSMESYQTGHLRGARWLDLAAWTAAAKSPQSGLDDPGYWKRQILRLGIAGDEVVNIYDGGEMTEAARVWFILQLVGVGRAAVVNGGWPAIAAVANAEQIESGPPPQVSSAYEFTGNMAPLVDLTDRAALRSELATHKSNPILDVRTADEFSGKDPRTNARSGHLPGAKSLPHKQLLEPDGRLKSPEELRRIFAQAGLKPGQRVAVHCQSGGRASLAALALVYSGFAPVENYYLSFGDWAADAGCPIEP